MDMPALPNTRENSPDVASSLDHAVSFPRPSWEFAAVAHHQHHAVVRFIRDGFEKAYGARIDVTLPALMALNHDGALAAACGLNRAEANRLFLEVYLDVPIERLLTERCGTRVARGSIIEVGNLTVARAGYARQLISHLTDHLHHRSTADWVVFSAVPQLRNNFVRLGIPLLALAPADPARLAPAQRVCWGTYYAGSPQVTAVKVAAAHAALLGRSCIR